jgi:hypothetical protein
MLTPQFGQLDGPLFINMVGAFRTRLLRQRGHRKPKANNVKTEASSKVITLIRNIWLYPVSFQDLPSAPTISNATQRNLNHPCNVRLIVIRHDSLCAWNHTSAHFALAGLSIGS